MRRRNMRASRNHSMSWCFTSMSWSFALLTAALVPPPVAAAEARPPRVESSATSRSDVAVTAYNNNLALVREVREAGSLPRGEFDLLFQDVPSLINPRTVSLHALGGGAIAVLEQNYEYDLVSPERLMEKAVGHDLDLVETGQNLTDRTTRATLLSTN